MSCTFRDFWFTFGFSFVRAPESNHIENAQDYTPSFLPCATLAKFGQDSGRKLLEQVTELVFTIFAFHSILADVKGSTDFFSFLYILSIDDRLGPTANLHHSSLPGMEVAQLFALL